MENNEAALTEAISSILDIAYNKGRSDAQSDFINMIELELDVLNENPEVYRYTIGTLERLLTKTKTLK